MKDNAGKIILSLLAGATAGVAAGLLLAPETGEDTRTNLKKSAAKLGDDVNKLLQKGQESLNDVKGSATDLVAQGRTAANDALNSLSTEAKDLAGKVTDQAKQFGTTVTDQAKQAADTVKGKAQDVAGEVTDAAQEAKAAVTDKAEEATKKVETAKATATGPQPTPKVDPIEAKAQHNATPNNNVG